ncbi:MAG: HAD hydrolase-like protein, partial [Acidobacteriota bacterium]|nr:HAD hydrolase-like protein [Acidobacteriota bacterium]
MFQLAVFDLDNTLIRTDDLVDIRPLGANNAASAYIQQVTSRALAHPDRVIYSLSKLHEIRLKFPDMKFAVFTRSPRSYSIALLQTFYPDFVWVSLVAYEDVTKTKPSGEGIYTAMKVAGVSDITKVLLIGDSSVDIASAYQAGCWCVLDRASWPGSFSKDNWRCMERVPDADISGPDQLVDFLSDPDSSLPLLEKLLMKGEGAPNVGSARIPVINHFDNVDKKPYVSVHVLGRSFSNYEALNIRRSWHQLSEQIGELKDAKVFPVTWIEALRHFLKRQPTVIFGGSVVVTVIPAKPGREPRMESLLHQLEKSHTSDPVSKVNLLFGNKTSVPGSNLEFFPDILFYLPGAQSHSKAHLNAHDRLVNVRDHLRVKNPSAIAGKTVIVFDDVTTTGASLVIAQAYMKEAGAKDVIA